MFDGFPMAQQGKAAQALTAAFTSSFVGALFAVLLITLVAPLVAKFALNFGPPEFFAVMFLSFASFVGLSRGSPLKTLAAMMLGFLLAAVGLGALLSTAAVFLEELRLERYPRWRDLLKLTFYGILENFGYRQINLVYRLRGIWRFWKGDTAWAAVPDPAAAWWSRSTSPPCRSPTPGCCFCSAPPASSSRGGAAAGAASQCAAGRGAWREGGRRRRRRSRPKRGPAPPRSLPGGRPRG